MTIYEPADWRPEPGDVAEVTTQFRTEDAVFGTDKKWHSISPGNIGAILVNPSRARHLARVDPASMVVLDPNNPDDVEKFSAAAVNHDGGDPAEAALRSLLPAVTPPEPNGLGAVVESGQGFRYVRGKSDGQPWFGSDGAWRTYSALDRPTVLSHGVGCSCGAPDCNGGDQ